MNLNTRINEYISYRKDRIKAILSQSNIRPYLVVIQVGDDPSSNSYIKGIEKDCEELGYSFSCARLDANIDSQSLKLVIDAFNKNPLVNGILLPMPLPALIEPMSAQNAIDPFKNIDGLTKDSNFKPCTPLGVIKYLKYHHYNFEGKNACVIGRSNTVGRPLAKMLLDLNCTVTVCHSKSDLHRVLPCQRIIFTCMDQIEALDETYFSPDQDVIDIGLGIGKDGKLHGNLTEEAYLNQKEYTGAENSVVISGVGGVGLLTRIELLENVLSSFIE